MSGIFPARSGGGFCEDTMPCGYCIWYVIYLCTIESFPQFQNLYFSKQCIIYVGEPEAASPRQKYLSSKSQVTSLLDYQNVIFKEMSLNPAWKLQLIHKVSYKILNFIRHFECFFLVHENLYWLPLFSRAEFKILVLKIPAGLQFRSLRKCLLLK